MDLLLLLSASQPVEGWVRKRGTPNYIQGAIAGTISSSTGLNQGVQLISED